MTPDEEAAHDDAQTKAYQSTIESSSLFHAGAGATKGILTFVALSLYDVGLLLWALEELTYTERKLNGQLETIGADLAKAPDAGGTRAEVEAMQTSWSVLKGDQ
jgi:hypothetical protein